MVIFNEERQNKQVEELHLREAEELAQVLAQKYGYPYLDLSVISINTDALRVISEDKARAARVAAFKLTGKNIYLAAMSPTSLQVKEIVEDLESKNFKVHLGIASESSLKRAHGRYSEIVHTTVTDIGIIQISSNTIEQTMHEVKTVSEIKGKILTAAEATIKGGGITEIVEIILSGALATEASDVHFEPQDSN